MSQVDDDLYDVEEHKLDTHETSSLLVETGNPQAQSRDYLSVVRVRFKSS